ncbi:MAG TPA: hypothetical protein VKB46_25455 [Pyrinomonadaceae bacterium]|nr:hypothetical protein [Pyrinomonadaceae bacterium]
MSELITGDESWNRMTEAEKTEVVRGGRATLRQLTQGLLDGPEQLRDACRNYLIHTGTSLAELPLDGLPIDQRRGDVLAEQSVRASLTSLVPSSRGRLSYRKARRRFALPEGFSPKLQRHGRAILLEENIYCLPNSQEFVPVQPKGPLGQGHHLYALLTIAQHQAGKRGSVYIRNDGRIFDYSFDTRDPQRDLFDTGYTIYDLERTGRYVKPPRAQKAKPVRKRKRKLARSRASKA